MEWRISELLTHWREGGDGKPGITEVFLAALGVDGRGGWQVELGFADTTTRSFQAAHLIVAVIEAHRWVEAHYQGLRRVPGL